jgi:hypothetical protein
MRALGYGLLATLTLSVAALGGACSSSGTGGSGGSATTGTVGQGAGGSQSTGTGFNTPDIASITITPADQVITVDNGAIPPATQLTAVATMTDGTTMPVTNATWTFDRPDVAKVNSGTGDAVATGLLGGKGKVTASVGNISGSTSLSVKLVYTVDPGNVDPSIKVQFPNATDPDPAMTLLYPYDKTVFPRGLHGPIIQWNGGGAGNIYQVHAVSPTFEFTGWGTVDPPSRYDFPTMPADIWAKLSGSTDGDITVSVQRYDGFKVYQPKQETWRIAPGNLAGTIYYWEVNNGNVVRLKPGDTAPENFLQKPPGHTCVACHSVSKNGSTLVAALDGGASPWATFNAADGANLYSSGQPSGFEAISPTGSHVLWGSWIDGSFNTSGQLTLTAANSNTPLAQLNPGGGAPSHPAWSSDAAKVAFSVRTDGNGLDFNHSTLWTADIDLANPAFTNVHQIVPNDASRPTVTFPTFSPDSKWIAFERSTQARSRGGLSDIWLTSPDGTTLIALDQANGTGLLQGAEASSSYEPTFNPVAVGGYFWLVIVSERTYGNTLTDTNPSTRHKQLWVTAIDQAPNAGQDPSHPAFWLPGQEIGNQNMRGEWALSPCKQMGSDCSAGYECCDGFCSDDGTGHFTCSTSQGCSHEGEACKTAADCCSAGSSCVGGFCSLVPN